MIEVNIVEHKELWIEYKEKKSQDAREKLILEYLPLVKYIAQRTAINLPSHIIIEDIINELEFKLNMLKNGNKED